MSVDPAIVAFGLGVGVLVGMTGIGGGSLMTPLLILVFGVKPVTAVGTDLAYGAVTKTVGGWRHLRQGVWLGSGLSVRVPTGALRTTLAIVLLGSGAGLLAKAGVGVPGALLGAFPILVAVLIIAVTVRDRREEARRQEERHPEIGEPLAWRGQGP